MYKELQKNQTFITQLSKMNPEPVELAPFARPIGCGMSKECPEAVTCAFSGATLREIHRPTDRPVSSSVVAGDLSTTAFCVTDRKRHEAGDLSLGEVTLANATPQVIAAAALQRTQGMVAGNCLLNLIREQQMRLVSDTPTNVREI